MARKKKVGYALSDSAVEKEAKERGKKECKKTSRSSERRRILQSGTLKLPPRITSQVRQHDRATLPVNKPTSATSVFQFIWAAETNRRELVETQWMATPPSGKDAKEGNGELPTCVAKTGAAWRPKCETEESGLQ